jgi:HEPN domain-containing protein
MDKAKPNEVCQWLIKSKRDLGAARLLIESEETYFDISVYHAQQAVEKAIKAYLTYQKVPFQKTHNLVALLALSIPLNLAFEQWRNVAVTLTPYATEFRYPGVGEFLEPQQSEAQQAVEMAEAFVAFVIQVLPTELGLE